MKDSDMVGKLVEIKVIIERKGEKKDYYFHGIVLSFDKEKLIIEDLLSRKKQYWDRNDIKDIHPMENIEQSVFFAKYPEALERWKLYALDNKIKNRFLEMLGG